MKRLLAILALAFGAAATGAAHAAIVTLPYAYQIDFASSNIASLGLSAGSSVGGLVKFDDILIVNDEYTVTTPGDFSFNLGNLTFNAASDLNGGPLVQFDALHTSITGILFDTPFSLSTGDYLLSLAGSQLTVTPAGNTTQFEAAGSVAVVPVPPAFAMFASSLLALGAMVRRKS